MSTREEDFVKEIHLADTHTRLLVFSSLGKVYSLKSHDIPEASLKAFKDASGMSCDLRE